MLNKQLPAGCDQQGRYSTRHEHWADAEWRDTVQVQRKPEPAPRKPEPPLTLGDALMAAAIVGVLCWIVSLGPWL